MMKKSICIIDDDSLYKLLLIKSINKLNMEVQINCFANGREGYDSIYKDLNTAENLPDIIFLDINMPEMDGWEFMDEFIQIQKSLSKKITIYIVSSSIAFQDTEKANRYKEISGYIIKPFQADCLKKILSDV